MRRTLTQSAVMKELESVAEQLAAVKTSRLKRLELLRRQAQRAGRPGSSNSGGRWPAQA